MVHERYNLLADLVVVTEWPHGDGASVMAIVRQSFMPPEAVAAMIVNTKVSVWGRVHNEDIWHRIAFDTHKNGRVKAVYVEDVEPTGAVASLLAQVPQRAIAAIELGFAKADKGGGK